MHWRRIRRFILIIGATTLAVVIGLSLLPVRLIFGAPNQIRITDRINRADVTITGLEFARGEFDRICFEPVVYERYILENLKYDWTFWSWYSADRGSENVSLVFFVTDGKTKYSLIRNLSFQAKKPNDSFGSRDCLPLANVSITFRWYRTHFTPSDVEEIDLVVSLNRLRAAAL